MSPTYIALIILLGVGLMAGIGFVIQDLENKKKAKSLKLIGLKTAIRRSSHLFESFPPALITTEIRTLLCKYIEARWAAVVELEPSDANKQQYSAFQAEAATLQEPVSHPAGSVTVFSSQTEAARAMGIIKEFAQFLAELGNKGEINSDLAERMTKDAKRLYLRVEIDIDLMNAIETEAAQGAEVVIHQYRSCFSKLQHLNHNQILDRQLYEIRTHLTTLAEQIDQAHEAKKLAEAQEQDSGKKFNF